MSGATVSGVTTRFVRNWLPGDRPPAWRAVLYKSCGDPKYAIALYEMIQLRANMDRCVETFPRARFRDLLGVPPGAYERGANFAARVTDPAVLEVNGLSDMGVELTLARRSKFAPIDGVTVSWWRKAGDEFRAAMRERNMSKVGRMARLKSAAETAAVAL